MVRTPAKKTMANAARFSRGEVLHGMGAPLMMKLKLKLKLKLDVEKLGNPEITGRLRADGIKPRTDDAIRGFMGRDENAGLRFADKNLQLGRQVQSCHM